MDRDEVLAHLRERIVAFAASRMRREAAEDLAQEVLVVLQEKYSAVADLPELLPLSLQILRFKLAAARRKAFRRGETGTVSIDDVQLPDPQPDPEAHARQEELLQRLTGAVQQLGERCREIIRLKLLGKSFVEIQEQLGAASINTVYTWDARCRKQLLQLMGGKWEADR